MNWCRSLSLLALTVGCIYGDDSRVTVTPSAGQTAASEGDTVFLTLPGAPAPTVPPKESTVDPQPAPEPPKTELPEAFKADSSAYLQRLIGTWKKSDADALLGAPLKSRPAYDEKKKVNGQIFEWPDPSGRYRELELDFEATTGTLRTIFAYPTQMTWEDCRKLWGSEVSTARTKDGRSFYSYLNRKLDVLVDRGGKVISLGLY